MALHGNDGARNGAWPAVTFGSTAEAAVALAVVAELAAAGALMPQGGAPRAASVPRGVVLLSAPGAAAWPGARVVAAMVEAATRAHPGVPHGAILDCGAAPGLALDALRRGWRGLILDLDCRAFGAVAAAATEVGASVMSARPAALDLSPLDLRKPGGRAIVARWLSAPDLGGPGDSGPGPG
jgi:hypothetical protein